MECSLSDMEVVKKGNTKVVWIINEIIWQFRYWKHFINMYLFKDNFFHICVALRKISCLSRFSYKLGLHLLPASWHGAGQDASLPPASLLCPGPSLLASPPNPPSRHLLRPVLHLVPRLLQPGNLWYSSVNYSPQSPNERRTGREQVFVFFSPSSTKPCCSPSSSPYDVVQELMGSAAPSPIHFQRDLVEHTVEDTLV